MKFIWRNRWFLLVSLMSVFILATATKAMAAGTDTQLDKILKAGVDGFIAFLGWLLDVLKELWK